MSFWLSFRLLLDRAHTDLDSIFHSLDSDPETEPLQDSSSTSSPLRNVEPASTSDANTSDRTNTSNNNHHPSSSIPSLSSSVDLSEILLNIKSCRWRHFRPRTLSHHPLGGGDISRYRRFNRTTSSGHSKLLGSGINTRPCTGPGATPVTGELVHCPVLEHSSLPKEVYASIQASDSLLESTGYFVSVTNYFALRNAGIGLAVHANLLLIPECKWDWPQPCDGVCFWHSVLTFKYNK